MNLLERKEEGYRHPHFYIIWRTGLEAGFSHDEIKDAIRWFNTNNCVPAHPSDVLEKKLRSFK